MILGITGHRPQKLYGFREKDPGNLFVINAIKYFLKEHKPETLVTGMALGVDQWAAQWCMVMKIPFIAMLPSETPYKAWPTKSQDKYHKILKNAVKVEVAPSNGLSYPALLQKRNEMIVDYSDEMLGIFGGGLGGTRNCLEYAKTNNKNIHIINPGDFYIS